MFIAVNDKKEKVHISKAVKGNNYYCPICNEILRINTGPQKAHYFSHLPNTLCKDSWKYDMSEWHFAWQEQFSMESQEVVFGRQTLICISFSLFFFTPNSRK